MSNETWDPDADLDQLQAQPFDPNYLEDNRCEHGLDLDGEYCRDCCSPSELRDGQPQFKLVNEE